MSCIQVDMFEVQLGAAVLLQMEDTAGALVRVLADGGIRIASPELFSKLQSEAS
jgi:hypothetical protein